MEWGGEVVNMIAMMVFQEQTEGAMKQTIDGLHIEELWNKLLMVCTLKE